MSTGSVRDLDRLREAASKGLLALLWAHLPLVAGLASLRGKGALVGRTRLAS